MFPQLKHSKGTGTPRVSDGDLSLLIINISEELDIILKTMVFLSKYG